MMHTFLRIHMCISLYIKIYIYIYRQRYDDVCFVSLGKTHYCFVVLIFFVLFCCHHVEIVIGNEDRMGNQPNRWPVPLYIYIYDIIYVYIYVYDICIYTHVYTKIYKCWGKCAIYHLLLRKCSSTV